MIVAIVTPIFQGITTLELYKFDPQDALDCGLSSNLAKSFLHAFAAL